MVVAFFVKRAATHSYLHSFPTRRSSDLQWHGEGELNKKLGWPDGRCLAQVEPQRGQVPGADRKSTRLNSSHSSISYAVFRLKKKMRHARPRRCWPFSRQKI